MSHVLVVEDEDSLRHTLTRILKRAGIEVCSVGSGREAIIQLGSTAFDLVYLDLRLPDIDGLQVLREIRQHTPQIPVVLFTGHGSLQSALEALRLGATDYLLKPVDPEVLLARTRVFLAEQSIERRKREIRQQIEALQTELRDLEARTKGADLPIASPSPSSLSEERFLKRGTLILDLQAQRATLGDRVILLPPSTFEYLVTLARHAPGIVDYQTLVTESQGYQVDLREGRELAKWHVHLIRQAIEPDPKHPIYLHNVRGSGYRLVLN